jgi:hypothetical protein
VDQQVYKVPQVLLVTLVMRGLQGQLVPLALQVQPVPLVYKVLLVLQEKLEQQVPLDLMVALAEQELLD